MLAAASLILVCNAFVVSPVPRLATASYRTSAPVALFGFFGGGKKDAPPKKPETVQDVKSAVAALDDAEVSF